MREVLEATGASVRAQMTVDKAFYLANHGEEP